ncbi:dual specificity protein phosphatase family protein [Paracoccus laeviglucosivorans]|uniref:Tyrosine phosphatase family protein n=1 Tax=Paracoccus laeviglucosivorans TaxID=1197861 RepID=A0A521F414_9RHOB|nr:dual specificity protein phosphatase family protein [Paracoccus laeviglucosivorans]SMO90341.1 Tyrosine phosphatase family protein [Paracoccus laeviglucosivorans]
MKRFRYLLSLVLVAVTLLAAHLLGLQFGGNFHAVVPGEAYRSGQPSAEDLTRWTYSHGIRSVINLRGTHVGTPWYDAEIAASEKLGLQHFDFAMSARKELSAQDAERLIGMLRDAPKPVLIHCMSGADRTGLAAALYLAQSGHDEDRAEAQISIRYGHLSIPYTAAWPMDQTWEKLEAMFGYES